jgi:hypothetical protein
VAEAPLETYQLTRKDRIVIPTISSYEWHKAVFHNSFGQLAKLLEKIPQEDTGN